MADEAKIQQLLAALGSEQLDARLKAIEQLAQIKALDAVPALIALLDDADFDVRMAAAGALGNLRDERAIPALERMAHQETGPLQSQAVTALIEIGTPQALAAVGGLSSGAEPPEEMEDGLIGDLLSDEETITAEGEKKLYDAWVDDDTGISLSDLEEAPAQPAAEAPPEPEPSPKPMPAPAAPPPPPAMAAPPAPVTRSLDRRQREESAPDDSSRPNEGDQTVQFSAYYPREVRPDDWQPLQAYVFKQFAADRVAEDAEKQLGPLARFRRIVESARRTIAEGETITATPLLPGFQFNPPTIAVGFFEDWHRFDFKMRAKDAPLNIAANGFVTFTVGGIIVADVPLSVFVTHEVTQEKPQGTDPRPIYDTVFASYSHKDTSVVEKVEVVAKSMGMDYLRDVITLRSGENWSDGLQNMIDRSTIFQMFWSLPYSQSPHCRHEWEYAYALKRENIHFIRPVYWLQPMPDPPSQIAHLHFTYQPDLVK